MCVYIYMRKVTLLLELHFFFINQYLRIKLTLSVINSPQMCLDICRGIYLSSCENFASTCSATLTSPGRAPATPSLLLHLERSAPRATKRVHLLLLSPTASQTGHGGVCALTLFDETLTTSILAPLKKLRHNRSDIF